MSLPRLCGVIKEVGQFTRRRPPELSGDAGELYKSKQHCCSLDEKQNASRSAQKF